MVPSVLSRQCSGRIWLGVKGVRATLKPQPSGFKPASVCRKAKFGITAGLRFRLADRVVPQGRGGNAALQELNWVLSGIIFSLSDLVPGSILSELSDTTRLLYLAQSIPRRMERRAWERLGLCSRYSACAQVYVFAHAVGLCPSLRGGAPSGAGGSSPPCRVIRRGVGLGWGKFALTQATDVAAPRGRRISAGQLFAVPTESAGTGTGHAATHPYSAPSVSRRRRAARSGQDRPRGAKAKARQRERKHQLPPRTTLSVSRRRRAARSGQDRPRGAKGKARQREREQNPSENTPPQIQPPTNPNPAPSTSTQAKGIPMVSDTPLIPSLHSDEDFLKTQMCFDVMVKAAELHRACPMTACRRSQRCCHPPLSQCGPLVLPGSYKAQMISLGMPFCMASVWDMIRDRVHLALLQDRP